MNDQNQVTRTLNERWKLCFLGGTKGHLELASEFAEKGLLCTVFLSPETLVLEAKAWTRLARKGVEIGLFAFHNTSVDGEIPQWKLTSVQEEIKSAKKLWQELELGKIESCFLPGMNHTCADGSYQYLFTSQFNFCVSENPRANFVKGEPVRFRVLTTPLIPVVPSEPPLPPSVVFLFDFESLSWENRHFRDLQQLFSDFISSEDADKGHRRLEDFVPIEEDFLPTFPL